MKRIHGFATLMGATGLAMLQVQPVLAQDAFPSEPIHITVAWPAGGGHDLVGRLIANELSEIMDTAVVVNNVTGAAGSTGIRHIAEADPDGYTIGVMGLHAVSQAFMNPAAPELESLQPLVYLSDEPGALQITADAGIETLDEYIAAMQDDPMAFLNGNDPQGGNSFVFANVIPPAIGVEMMRLPYPGHAPTVTALLTGEVQTTTLPIPPILEHANAGTVRVLAVASEERHPQLPDVPTFQELGHDVVVSDFVMLVGPAGIPEDIRAQLEEGLLAAINSDGFQEAAMQNGMVLRPGGGEMATDELSRQIETVYPILEEAGLVADGLERE